jgi:hypothetical protein
VAVLGVAFVPVPTRVVVRFAVVFGAAVAFLAAAGAAAGLVDRVFGAAAFGAAALGAAALGAGALGAGALGAAAFGAASAAAAFFGGSATASTTRPGVSDDERTFDQVRSPRSARLP